MQSNTILKLPSDIISNITTFHPLFYKYTRKYTKLIVYNSDISSSCEITKEEFFLLQQQYTCIYVDIVLDKINKIIYNTITLFFESNC